MNRSILARITKTAKASLAVALTALAFTASSMAAAVPANAAETAPTGIISGIGNKCIDIKNNQRYNGATVWLYTCDGNPAQQWTMNANGTISNQGYCLDIQGMKFAQKTPIWLWECVNNSAQIWQKQADGTLRNPASNMCMDAMWGNSANGTTMWLWPCVANAAQTWFTPYGPAVNWTSTVNPLPGNAWHRMAKLNDGSWLQVGTVFVNQGRSELAVYKSTDNARTWQFLAQVNDGNRLVDNGTLYQAPDGSVLLAARDNIPGSSYRIAQWRSANNGTSWARENNIDTGTRGLYEPFYFTATNNRTVMLYADEGRSGYSQVIHQRISTDSGRTWTNEAVAVSDGANGRPGMSVVTRMTNGQFMMVYEICGTRDCNVFQKVSSDGVYWPSGIGTYIPGVQCGPFVTSLSDGRVAVTGCRTASNNYDTPLLISDNFGGTWRAQASAFPGAGQFGDWPALYQTGSNELGAVGSRIRFGTIQPRAY